MMYAKLRLAKSVLLTLTILAFSTLITGKASATSSTSGGSLGLSFVVPEVCKIETQSIAPAPIQITDLDIARGYVDLTSNSTINLLINTEAQFSIAFELDSPIFKGLSLINTKNQKLEHKCHGDSRSQICDGNTNQPEQLRLRFLISQNSKPGTYSWPLRAGATTCATI